LIINAHGLRAILRAHLAFNGRANVYGFSHASRSDLTPRRAINQMKISIDSVQSVSIRNEYLAAHCNHAEFFGTFRHPEHSENQDWCISLYSVCDELVFATNGDAVWEVSNCNDFAALVLEYGINIEEALAE
jgi:hypothetical protein